MSQKLKPQQQMLILTGAVALASLALPILSWVFLPVQFLNTHVHEFFHAASAILSGGEVGHIAVLGSGGGVTYVNGGSALLTGSAGYLGSSILGALLVVLSGSDKGARTACWILGSLIGLSMLLWVRADWTGVIWGLAWVAGLFAAGAWLKGSTLHFAGQLIGMLLCLSAAQSLLTLLGISATTGLHSDARLLEMVTRVPAIAWAFVWLFFGLASMVGALRTAWKQESAEA
ncbi:MAG: M50 family metallopeptidase [Fimbriimonadaceae bacterium]